MREPGKYFPGTTAMRRRLCAAFGLLLLVVPLVLGGPVQPFGGETGFFNIHLEPFSVRNFTEEFKADEPATIIAIGRGNTPLGLYVYDVHGNCVAWDDVSFSLQRISDDLAVFWHPPQESAYEIELRNMGRVTNRVELALH